jgi:rhodanese-related sulfurtransferase
MTIPDTLPIPPTSFTDVATLRAWLEDGGEVAFVDIREEGLHGEGHPLLAVNIPYSRLERVFPDLVPRPATQIVLLAEDGPVGPRAARHLVAAGYSAVYAAGWRGGLDGVRRGVVPQHQRAEQGVCRSGRACVPHAGYRGGGIGRAARRAGDEPDAKMVKPGGMAVHRASDLPDASCPCELPIEQRHQMVFGAQLTDPSVRAVLFNQGIENRSWKMVHHGMKHAILMRHGIAPMMSMDAAKRRTPLESMPCILDSKIEPDSRDLHPHAAGLLQAGVSPRRSGNAHPSIAPYEMFETATGPLFLGVGNDRQFRQACQMLGCPDLALDERFRTMLRVANTCFSPVKGTNRLLYELSYLGCNESVSLADRDGPKGHEDARRA